MRLALVLAVAACGTSPRTDSDASLPPEDTATGPDAEVDTYNRVVNRVLVDRDKVFWSHGQEACHLENPCANDGPAMTSLWLYNNTASITLEGGVGARFITGTKDQMYFVTGSSPEAMYVMRTGLPHAGMSLPRADTVGPALDATHVYWADLSYTPTELRYTLKRTAKDGDASVVEELATVTGSQMYRETEIVHAGGYIWWDSPGGVRRVPVTGGPSELISLKYATAIVAGENAIFVGARNGDTDLVEIHRIDADGTLTPLILDAPAHAYKAVRFMLVVEDRVWWSIEDGNIYNVPTSGGALTTFPVGDDAGRAFVVLPDRFLVGLRFTTFRSVPR